MEKLLLQLGKAVILSMNAHRGQKRRSGEAFIIHPLMVAYASLGDIEDMIIAVLHDVVEKSEFTVRDVAIQIDLCPGMEFSLDCITKRPGEDRMSYIYRVMMDMRSRRVKKRDMLHNLSTNPTEENKIFYKYALGLMDQSSTVK